MGKLIVREYCRHQPLLGERHCDTGRVAGNPPAPPLLGYKSCCATATTDVQYQIARVGGHQEATFYNLDISLNHVEFASRTAQPSPNVAIWNKIEILSVSFENQTGLLCDNAPHFE
jgi:hypothetical protein